MSVDGRLPTGTTRVAAVIGDPVHHSLSPTLMNVAFQHAGLDWVFTAFEVPSGAARGAIDAMRSLPLAGLSVTMPHKAAVIDHLDALSPTAERLGAVNCVVWEESRLVGHSTDGAGLIDALRVDENFEPEGKRCVVIGAGGAARAAVAALADAGVAEVAVVNRTPERGEAACLLAGGRGRVGVPEEVATADLIVNATPIGMGSDAVRKMPFDPGRVSAGQTVFDMIYDPPVTSVVAAARERGVHAVGGIGMLVHQAVHAFTKWTGEAPSIDVMRHAGAAEIDRRRGIS